MKSNKCEDCNKEYDPDQYYFWCNKCGEKNEKDWIEYLRQVAKDYDDDRGWQS